MNIPKLPVETTPFIWGAVAGAVLAAIVGFNWGGWVTGGTSEKLAMERADAAIVSVLTPVCVAQFKKSADVSTNLVALKKIDSWQQSEYVGKGGWATMPGAEKPDRLVAGACMDKLAMNF